jgi:hypothetical protein
MLGYVVVQLRRGDIVRMCRLFLSRNAAFQYLAEQEDTTSSWWKVVEIESNHIAPNARCEVVLDIAWDRNNRVKIIGVYAEDGIPNEIKEKDEYFAELLACE